MFAVAYFSQEATRCHLAIVDRNFPAASCADRLVELSGTSITEVARAVFTVFPVDTFLSPALFRMGPVGDEASELPAHREFQDVLDAHQRVGPARRCA